MKVVKEESKHVPVSLKVTEFLHKRTKMLIALLVVLIILFAGLGIIEKVKNDKKFNSAIQEELLQEQYDAWLSADETNSEALKDELSASIKISTEKFSGTFTEQRALFIQGHMAIKEEEWSLAADSFGKIAKKYPKSYLAPLCLYNQAGSLEMAGELEEAILVWEVLVEGYKGQSPHAPEALFNIARVQEALGETDKALGSYKKLITDFKGNNWTNIVKTRIIFLETMGN